MKKISLYAASLIAMGLGLTACDQLHNDLRLEVPTSYTLDTPSNADQLITFGPDSNVGNEWEIVTYNPYNVNTTVDYQVQVAKSASDFDTYDNLLAQAAGSGETDFDFKDADGLPYATFVSGTYLSPSFTVPGEDFCDAINSVYGFESADDITEHVQVAYRVYAWVPGVEYSFIFSNAVTLAQVDTFIPIRGARKIYVIGLCQGWDINSDAMFVSESDPGSNFYTGSINVAEGEFLFRFYTALGSWEANSLGSQEEDTPIDITFDNDEYFGDVVSGKGSWSYPEWTGGSVDIELDLNAYTVKFTLHEGEEAAPVPTGNVLYLIGSPQGWDINGDSIWIQETENGSNIYSGTITVAAGQFQFRFYSALGKWDEYSVGSQDEDANVDITFTDDQYEGPVVAYDSATGILGKGNWQYTAWPGGTIDVTVNLNDYTITMIAHEGEVSGGTETPDTPANNDIYIRGDMNDWGTDAAWAFTEISDTEWEIADITIPAGVQFKVADANWGAVNLGGPGEEEGVVVTPGQEFTLVASGKNLILNAEFTGKVTLTLTDDTYTLLLTPGN